MKKILKTILDLYIYSNLHVALSISMLYFIFNKYHFNFIYFAFLFFSTIFSYNMIRLMLLESNRKEFLKLFYKYKLIFLSLFFLSFFFSLSLFFYLPTKVKFSLIPLVIITFFYQSNFPAFSFRQNGILKIVTVAFVWAMLIVVIPDLYYNIEDLYYNIEGSQLIIKFLFVFLYVLLLTLSFDQRDILIDSRDLGTLPQLFPHYKKYIYLIFALLLIPLSTLIFEGLERYVAIFILLLSLVFSWFSDIKKSFYYTSFLIEGIPILWGVIILVLKKGLM